jgi:hypothetical protein
MAETDKSPATAPEPGQVIAPGGNSTAATQSATPSAPVAPAPISTASLQPAAPAAATPDSDIPDDRRQLYKSPLSQEDIPQSDQLNGEVTWTASEFVAHEKSAGWYGRLVIIAVVIAAFVYLLTRDPVSTVVVLVCAAALGVLGAKKPRQLQYRMDGSGITVGQKHYSYESFRSFSVAPEGAFSSIIFMPLKRFAPLTTIYFAPADESKIIGLLVDRLPFEEHKAAVIDSLMQRIRF